MNKTYYVASDNRSLENIFPVHFFGGQNGQCALEFFYIHNSTPSTKVFSFVLNIKIHARGAY